jgi:hypothetical protein
MKNPKSGSGPKPGKPKPGKPDVIKTSHGAYAAKSGYRRPKKNEEIVSKEGVLVAKKGNKQARELRLTLGTTMQSLPKRKQKWAMKDNGRIISAMLARPSTPTGPQSNNAAPTPNRTVADWKKSGQWEKLSQSEKKSIENQESLKIAREVIKSKLPRVGRK